MRVLRGLGWGLLPEWDSAELVSWQTESSLQAWASLPLLRRRPVAAAESLQHCPEMAFGAQPPWVETRSPFLKEGTGTAMVPEQLPSCPAESPQRDRRWNLLLRAEVDQPAMLETLLSAWIRLPLEPPEERQTLAVYVVVQHWFRSTELVSELD